MHAAGSTSETGWGSPTWRWGYASGDAHDAAFQIRNSLSSPQARREWIASLEDSNSDVPWFEIKLVLALKWQKAIREGRCCDGWVETMERLRLAEYEDGENGISKFVVDLAKDLVSADQKSERDVASQVLKALEFVKLGL
eukprot:CAMPEP_0196579862 /NCGR_PEP_ID=MMETSP1081-20130531/25296_1 /TAXON_ID=36882 /ORGANISM="Pyramimonas amylifera, Strain CCMP720" /LENGTH=139 /DNA_ID=CAMNT_0041899567 /DNA_START=275 /DNA_END=694 /DNA_ORIENTATION=+